MGLGKLKWSQIPEAERPEIWKGVARRWDQLVDEKKEWTERISKYLLLINSGGAATLLTFIGTSAEVRTMITPYLALAAFCAGILLVGYFHASSFAQVGNLFYEWRKGAGDLLEDKITLEQLRAEDNKRVIEGNRLPEILAKASFGAFHFGLFIGLIGLTSDWIVRILKAICPD